MSTAWTTSQRYIKRLSKRARVSNRVSRTFIVYINCESKSVEFLFLQKDFFLEEHIIIFIATAGQFMTNMYDLRYPYNNNNKNQAMTVQSTILSNIFLLVIRLVVQLARLKRELDCVL